MIINRLFLEVKYFIKKKIRENFNSVCLKQYYADEWTIWTQDYNNYDRASDNSFKQLSIFYKRLERLDSQHVNEIKCAKEEISKADTEKKEMINFLKKNTKSFIIII